MSAAVFEGEGSWVVLNANHPPPEVPEPASSTKGLSQADARRKLAQRRRLEGHPSRVAATVRLFLRQFRSPLVMLLMGAMLAAMLLGDKGDALVVGAILLMSGTLGFWQERSALQAVEALSRRIELKASVLRDGTIREIPATEVVEGDMVELNAGDAVPGDGVLLEAKDLHVDESALTGESFPTEKMAARETAVGPESMVRAGSHVVGGIARALMLRTGAATEFGAMPGKLRLRKPETDFERGLARLGGMLLETTMFFVVAVFAINSALGRPLAESLLFTLALAVGMAPELLPAITTITLARGAKRMARAHVIVKRPAAIESFGGMTVLCADKTGTLTEGRMALAAALDASGDSSDRVLFLASLNSRFESGFSNPIDNALRNLCGEALHGWQKLDEVPYSFLRRRLSILAHPAGATAPALMCTKGAVPSVLEICTRARMPGGLAEIGSAREPLMALFSRLSGEGKRVIAVASREDGLKPAMGAADERDMVFEGFVVFEDPPRPDAEAMVRRLADLGVDFKIVTGDNRFVAERIVRGLGINHPHVLTGEKIRRMKEAALVKRAVGVHVFAEMEPDLKERVILALKRAGAVVGFLGDGINDAPALHAADVAISVDAAVDVAREAADIVLLRHSLGVVAEGITNGRATMANTLKYLRIATSANFGNMFSMASAAYFLPFLPLLPGQILLNNFLADLPALAIAADTVDAAATRRPLAWDICRLGRFMAVFGLASSAFDMAAFALLFFVVRAGEREFQTLWFTESLLTQVLVILVLRTADPCLLSRPSPLVGWAIVLTAIVAVAIPVLGWPQFLGFVPAGAKGLAAVFGVTGLYLAATEMLKRTMGRKTALF